MKAPKLDRKIAAWVARQPLVAGEIRHVIVQHDDWCRFLTGKGDCNCNPDFAFAPGVPVGALAYGFHVFPAPPVTNN